MQKYFVNHTERKRYYTELQKVLWRKKCFHTMFETFKSFEFWNQS